MTAVLAESVHPQDGEKRESSMLRAVKDASERIAPTWPLDQMIAVNPWWEMRSEAMSAVAARLSVLSQTQCLMPRSYYREQWQQLILPRHLEAAALELEGAYDADQLCDWLQSSDALTHWYNFSDQVDETRDLERQVSWHDEIVHQISQFCASYFSEDTPMRAGRQTGLYATWLGTIRHDRGIEIMMGEPGLTAQFGELPTNAHELIELASAELELPADLAVVYFHALLLDINGWSSWAAYLRWQSALAGGSEDPGVELVAIRLAWELALWRHQQARHGANAAALRTRWQQQFRRLPEIVGWHRAAQRPGWIWQRALEMAYQEQLQEKFSQPVPPATADRPRLQAAFCIDVRSEVFRRALEAQGAQIQTMGFAGFFGLPIAYQPAGTTYSRPQLPGLLSPALTVSEDFSAAADELQRRSARLNLAARWQAFAKKSPSSFGYVEATGLTFAFKLLRECFLGEDPAHPVNSCASSVPLTLQSAERKLDSEETAALVSGVLGAMTLVENFAPIVMLIGHGSSTRNNPHAAGLDCGACGGQTGEINVRVLAQALNDPAVRAALPGHGITIPPDTVFVPALHDTTTDDIRCFGSLPESFADVDRWLQAAGDTARSERARKLGIAAADSTPAIRRRSRDWSQVRPEWGLANNACFIVAPRQRTRHLNFDGRSFLHDYVWEQDAQRDFATLELIMTAPMIVTNWINMQYNASTTDNTRYGSGNKVLHNVVGGNLGVFEGNGGDLRIGLSMQSLHDGEQWMHQMQRLSVYLAAPAAAIEEIARKHAVVRQLIDNDWLYLFRLDDAANTVLRYYKGQWKPAAAPAQTAG